MSTTSTPTFNPHASFTAADGFRYENYAAFLCGEREQSRRNARLARFRGAGRSEAAIKAWIEAYDAPVEPRYLDCNDSEEVRRNNRAEASAWLVNDIELVPAERVVGEFNSAVPF